MTKKILYVSCGIGSGGLVKGQALAKAAKRSGLDIEVGFALGSAYEYLLDKGHYLKRIPQNCTADSKFVEAAIIEYEPDLVISCYKIRGVQEAIQRQGVPGVLLWRNTTDYRVSLGGVNPEAWQHVIAIEPGAEYELATAFQQEQIIKSPPIYSVWEDELLPREEARKYLLDRWQLIDRGRPLMLCAHNGVGSDELNLLAPIACKLGGNQYHTVVYTQNTRSSYLNIKEPIAKYFKAVDYLVAYAGPTIYWEWQRYKNPDAKEKWFVAERSNDPQDLRGSLTQPNEFLYNRVNGAEFILTQTSILR